MTNSSCFVSSLHQQRSNARWLDAVDLGKALDSFSLRDGFRANTHFVRMMLDDPKSKLPSNRGFLNAFDHLDARLAQNSNPLAIDARMRVTHADHDSRNAARRNRSR